MGQEKEIKECANVLNTKLTKMEMEKITQEEREISIWNHCAALDAEMLKIDQRRHKKWEADREYFEKHGHHPDSRDV